MPDVLVFENLIDSDTGQPITMTVPDASPVTLKTRAIRREYIEMLGRESADRLKDMFNDH